MLAAIEILIRRGDYMANKRFGDTLRELRNQKGYTQQQVAEMLELKNKSTLGSWEIGKSEPDGYTLLRLCKIYGVEDIYSAFGEVPPIQFGSDIQSERPEKYHLLNDDSKKIVDNLVEHLLGLQGQREKQ